MSDELVKELAGICGPEHCREPADGDRVAGLAPAVVVAPADAGQLSQVLAAAAAAGRTVVPRGAGTKQCWAPPPSTVDILLDTGRISGVYRHEAGDLVATVGAGTPLSEVAATLARAGQRLSLTSGYPDATVGGVLATAEAGPLRLRYGTPRDLLIGARFVRADGVAAHSGGQVVKNVAGYDLGKLLCGSYGTLAVLTEATFRLHPLPPARAFVTRTVSEPAAVRDLVCALLAATVAPAAVELDLPPVGRPGEAEPPGARRGGGELVVLLEGSPSGVDERAEQVRRLLGGGALVHDEPPDWWGGYPFRPFRLGASDAAPRPGAVVEPGGVGLKLSVPVTELPAAIFAVHDAAGAAVSLRGSAGTGVLYAGLPPALPADRVAAVVTAVRQTLLARRGWCVALGAPEEVRAQVDPWGPAPGLDLMRRVKQRFDPDRLLAPGRFVGGI